MPTLEKSQVIEQTKDWYQRASGILFTDYRGLKVHEIHDLRAKLREKSCELHVIKNTLFRIAIGEETNKLSHDMHNGPTAFTFIFGNEPEGAKVLADFAKTNKKLIIKGGLINGKAFDSKQIESLAKLPPREVLIAQVIGAIAAPISQLIGTVEALYADPIRTIGAVADKAQEQSA